MKELSRLSILNNNNHLKDIFTKAFYIEIGNIEYDKISILLRNELIKFEDLVNVNILYNSKNRFNTNSDIDTLLSALYFENINHKNKNRQIFITYGIANWIDKNKKEIFAPIILIPVNIYIQEDDIYVKKIATPVENKILISMLASEDKNIVNPDNLNTIYALDKYILNFEKYGVSVKLENMITFAYTSNKDIKIDHEKFDISKINDQYIIDKYYHPENENFFLVSDLDKKQRVCLKMANNDLSFAISGKLGTGKTETLINIAVNALYNNKKVLYVSNIKETIDYVEARFDELNVSYSVANLLKSFDEVISKKQYQFPKKKQIVANLKEELTKTYEIINNYETQLNFRVLNHNYLLVMNSLVSFDKKNSKKIEIDDLSNLYKEEFEKTVHSLEMATILFDKIPSFKDSIWSNIPINNNVNFPNQVINLVFQMKSFYTQMQEEAKALEKKYGFKPITYYASLRNVINNFKSLKYDEVLSFWVDNSLEMYFKAREVFVDLKKDYLEIKNFRDFLNSKYFELEELDIKLEIKQLYSYQFSKNEIDKIDFLFEKRNILEPKINRGEIQRGIIFKTIEKIAQFIEAENDKTDEFVLEIVRLSRFLSQYVYHAWWLDIETENEFQYKLKRIKDSFNHLKELDEVKKEFINQFQKFAYKDSDYIIKVIDDIIESRKIEKSDMKLASVIRKSKLGPHNLKIIVEKLKYLRKNYNKAKNIFFEETGFNFQVDVDIIKDYEKCFEYINNINPKYKETFVKYLRSVYFKYSKIDIPIQTFNLLLKSMDDLDILYEELGDYYFDIKYNSYYDKLEKVSLIFKYLSKIYYGSDKVKTTSKQVKNEVITSKDFFNIESDIDYINKLEKNFDNNKTYKELFDNLFNGTKTDVDKISNLIQTLDNFVNCFIGPEAAANSLDLKNYNKINLQLSYLREVAEDANDVLKTYSKTFKGVVSKYYYETFDYNLSILDKKLEAKEELGIYLTITKHFKKILKYNLTKLVNSCLEEKNIRKLVNNFKYTYYLMVYEMFKEKITLLSNNELKDALEKAYSLERQLIEENQSTLLKNYNRILEGKKHLKNLDYVGLISKSTNKKIFLTDTEVLNNFFESSAFDLVIIDDAYALEAEAYYKAIMGRQVIIAGEEPKKSFSANTLLSRMKEKNILHFTRSYNSVPKNLLEHSGNSSGIIKNSLVENKGITVVKQKLEEKIVMLLQNNEDLKINVYIASLAKMKDFYEKLAIAFIKKGYSGYRIFKILTYNINICDALDYYLVKSDYNVLTLECYHDIDKEHSAALVIDMLMLVQKEVWIYDSNNFLNKKSLLSEKLNKYINDIKSFDYKYDNKAVLKLAKALQLSGIEVLGRHDDLDIMIKYNEKISGIMILWTFDNLRYEVLNDFRYFVKEYQKHEIKVFIVTIEEILIDVKEVVKRITGEL